MAGTTYCDPPFCHVLRYLEISQRKAMNLDAILITERFELQIFTISCHYVKFRYNSDMLWLS